jgi:glutamate 5-kinase
VTTPLDRRAVLGGARRIVVKIGSGVLASHARGINTRRIGLLARECAALAADGYQLAIVSSGAIASGLAPLGLRERPKSIPLKQAAAAVGQSRLMWAYERAFGRHGRHVAQILLTADDLANRTRFLNARHTLLTLLDLGVIPIINENDTVAVDEIKFGDNDTLASLVIGLIDARVLAILSDVDGLYTRDPRLHPNATRLTEVARVTPEIERTAGGSSAAEGTGGMASKVGAAKRVAAYGASTLILDGCRSGVLTRALGGEPVGTMFFPRPERLNSRQHWIAHAVRVSGTLWLDAGAVHAVVHGKKSLLPSGITNVSGEFHAGDAVACVDPHGHTVARGLVNYGSAEVARIQGVKTSEIAKRLGYKYYDEVIHRDNLVDLSDRSDHD